MIQSDHPDPEVRKISNQLLAEAQSDSHFGLAAFLRNKSIRNFILFYGGIAVAIFAYLKLGEKISDADLMQIDHCQSLLVSGNFGVTYEPDTKSYTYSKSKFDELRRLTFLMECMPESDPLRRERAARIIKLRKEIDDALKNLGM